MFGDILLIHFYPNARLAKDSFDALAGSADQNIQAIENVTAVYGPEWTVRLGPPELESVKDCLG